MFVAKWKKLTLSKATNLEQHIIYFMAHAIYLIDGKISVQLHLEKRKENTKY